MPINQLAVKKEILKSKGDCEQKTLYKGINHVFFETSLVCYYCQWIRDYCTKVKEKMLKVRGGGVEMTFHKLEISSKYVNTAENSNITLEESSNFCSFHYFTLVYVLFSSSNKPSKHNITNPGFSCFRYSNSSAHMFEMILCFV